MKKKRPLIIALAVFLTLLLGAPQVLVAQSTGEDKPFKQEELDQLVAPVALYPDSLLAQIFMASTYPLEVVMAGKWAKANQSLKGDALAAALEKENWDPSVKSLVNFPQVLDMMNEKLEWTQKMGDAFLAQQKDVMGAVQRLRAKAQASGNLKTTQEQVVKVEKEVIIIEPASPQVIYVPAYNPTVVYGAWAYPAYPPYPVYPPGYVATTAAFSFMAGAAVGAAWGYAWGNANWHGGDIDINYNQNVNINNNINREKYKQQYQAKGQAGQGQWQHDASHRGGVAYRDQGTAQRYDRGASKDAKSREAFRGRAESGRQDIARGGADEFRGRSGADRSSAGTLDRGGAQQRGDTGGVDRAGSRQGADKSTFAADRGGQTRDFSSRGHQSVSASKAGGMSRGGGGGRGGGRR